jgi:hypothetical protein
MAFGKYIRREREGQELTLTELARQVEVTSPICPALSASGRTRHPTGWYRPWPVRLACQPTDCLPQLSGYRRTCGPVQRM